MRRIITLMLLLASVSASALTKPQKNFARNFAMLGYASKRCPQLRVNELQLAQAMTQFGLPKGSLEPGGEIAEEAKTEMGRLESSFGSQSDEQFCGFMEDAFGPGGTIAAGFLKRR